MTDKFIPVSKAFARWREDPESVAAYDALEEEFALAHALIEARAHADMTQAQVAETMGTTQAVIARLESGRTMPFTLRPASPTPPAPNSGSASCPIPRRTARPAWLPGRSVPRVS